MTPTEQKILRKAVKGIDKVDLQDREFVNRLSGYADEYRLNAQNRNRLYRIGKIFGIDGRKEFAEDALRRAEEKIEENKAQN